MKSGSSIATLILMLMLLVIILVSSFKTVASVPLSSEPALSYLPDFGKLKFGPSTVSVNDVVSILNNFDSKKTTGCDQLLLWLVKACPAEMGKLVATIIDKQQ